MYHLFLPFSLGCPGVQCLAGLQFREHTVLTHHRPSPMFVFACAPSMWRCSPGSLLCQPPSRSYLPNSYTCLSRLSLNSTFFVMPFLIPPARIISFILCATQHLVFNLYNFIYHIFKIHSYYALSLSLNCKLLKTVTYNLA